VGVAIGGGGGGAVVVVVSAGGVICSVGSGSDASEVAAAVGASVVVVSVSSPKMPAVTNRVRSPPRVMAHQRRYQGLLDSPAESPRSGSGSRFGMVTIVLSGRVAGS
jgi:hypothetical protein